MAKYRLKFPDDEDRFEELARISFNLRHFSKIWKEHFGAKNRINMAYWEQKLDEFIKENVVLGIDEEIKQEIVSETGIWHKTGFRHKLTDNFD